MHRRSAVTYVGDDPEMRTRVSRAVETAWGEEGAPDYRATATDALIEATDDVELQPLADACGIVTTTGAAAEASVADRLAATPESVPVIVALDTVTTEAFRTALRAGAADVVTGPPPDAPISGSQADPLVERLLDVVEPERVRFGSDDAARLREVLLDSGSTLMSTRSDEVDTKIDWTIENVGEHAELDRIVCYLREEGGELFDPAYAWCPGGCDTAVRSFDEFPGSERLSTFENAVRSAAPPLSVEGAVAEGDASRAAEAEPPMTVHVPLVVDWDLVGVLAFEADARRVWTDEEVDLYRTFGDLIAYTIARNDRRLELRRRTEQLEQFSSVVSHDLRNPLNVLSGYLELVEGTVPASTYEPMDRAVTRMETLIDNLLMLARRGNAIGEIELTSVARVAEGAWETVRAPDATLTVADDLGRVSADPTRLRQAFENLFRNAVDHAGPGVAIEIGSRTGETGDGVYIADDGPGVPPDVRDSLFDAGFSTAGSSGIGLAIVDRIVDAHGWEVDVHNDGGAVFEVSFGTGTATRPV
ncbi:sensor histidine kinase [Halorubrum lipolyticum]|uniref:histidine kinase n=1 Tax=Halorubrum lipolyticum DSM 21995 TaxID=1227482 RepID=M0P346_9EURY|nr:GAF domain-containing sensor histidine kinase [Halorubrum lipolyticum]EMA64258.1 histidine kinase [Halorubrum lipolyticum DSM 21995]